MTDIKLVYGNYTATSSKLADVTIQKVTNSGDALTMGCTCCSSFSATILVDNTTAPMLSENALVDLQIKEGASWTSIGKFYLTDIQTEKNKAYITGYDAMFKLSGAYSPQINTTTPYLQDVWSDINRQINPITLDSISGYTNYQISNFQISEGATLQDAVGWLAGCMGKQAYADGTTIRFGWYSDRNGYALELTSSNIEYNWKKLTNAPQVIKSMATGTVSSPITKGDGTVGVQLNFENPWITDAMATAIWNRVSNTTFQPFSCTLHNDTYANEIFNTSLNHYYREDESSGNNVNVYAMNETFHFSKQGYSVDIKCSGNSRIKNEFDTNFRSVSDVIEGNYTDLENAILNLTNAITGNTGGFVKLYDKPNQQGVTDGIPDEILIMDHPDISNAQKIWVWNANGLAYSKTGYSGDFITGISAMEDGTVVAKNVKSGYVDACEIKSCIGEIGGWNIGSTGISATYVETEQGLPPRNWKVILNAPNEQYGGGIEWDTKITVDEQEQTKHCRLIPVKKNIIGDFESDIRYGVMLEGDSEYFSRELENHKPTLWVGDLAVGLGGDVPGHLYLNGHEITGGGEPSAYIKSASVSGNTLTLTKKDDTTVTFTPTATFG